MKAIAVYFVLGFLLTFGALKIASTRYRTAGDYPTVLYDTWAGKAYKRSATGAWQQ